MPKPPVAQWEVLAFAMALMPPGHGFLKSDLAGLPFVSTWYARYSRARFPGQQAARRLQEHTAPTSRFIKSEPKYEPYLFDRDGSGHWVLTLEGRKYVRDILRPERGAIIVDSCGSPGDMEHLSPVAPLQRQPTESDSRRPLPFKDAGDVEGVRSSQHVRFARRHNEMTNRLKEILEAEGFVLEEGTRAEAMFDVLVRGRSEGELDVLVEVKSTTHRGAVRLAVGQLLDYRRHIPNRERTMLALLLPERPPLNIREYLDDLQISLLWFECDESESLAELRGWPIVR